MSIGKRVSATLGALAKGDHEQALHDICSAIEVTATKEAGKSGRRSYKDFIADNLVLITRSAFGVDGTWGSMGFKYDHPDVKPGPNGFCSFEDIMYHVVRCGLYHEATLPSSLTFTNNNVISCDGGKTLSLPAALTKGLTVAVLTSPVNAGEGIDPRYEINIDFVKIVANKLWGKRAALTALLEGIVSVWEAIKAIEC